MQRFVSTVILWCIALLMMVGTAYGQSASELVDLSGLRGGIAFLPRASDEEMALELARRDGFLVYAQVPDETRVQGLRAKAAESGLLAKTLYAGVGSADHLPLAERAASLVLVTDLSSSDLTESRRSAWLRALAPRRGVAIFGSPSASQLDEEKLRTWLSGQPDVQVFRQGNGLWVSCRREPDSDADQWPQKFRDASNARVSNDHTFRAPFLPAWYALPMHLGYWGDTMVSANGRAYLVWANRAFNTSVSLIARDIHSGIKLWEHPCSWDEPRDKNHSGYFSGRSCLFADGDILYLVDEADLVLVDGETGDAIGRIQGPQGDGQIKWMGAEDGRMALLAGDADRYRISSLQQACTNPVGRKLAVYDLRTRQPLWTTTEQSDIDQREVAILGGRMYYHAIGQRVACRDLSTGKLLWENRDPRLLELLGDRVRETGALLISARGMAAQPSALYFAAAWVKHRVAIDPNTGKLLWSQPVSRTGRALRDLLYNDTLYADGKIDLTTGDVIEPFRVPSDGCGPSFAAPECIVTAFGGVSTFDGDILRNADLKPACDLGVIISDGVAMSPPGVCRCGLPIQGYRAFTHARPLHLGVDNLDGPAASNSLGKPAEPADWPTFRGDNQRSGSTPLNVTERPPQLCWQWTPPVPYAVAIPNTGYGAKCLETPEHLPTQVVTAGEMGFVGDADGVIRALHLSDGSERWRYFVGSKFFAPPTYHRGRIVAGAADGWVYCLDAADGRLAWRRRVAPSDRRIMWYGHLASTWPLSGGVIVQDDIVYAVAGFQAGYGVHAAALRLADGTPVWRRDDAGGTNPVEGIGSVGGLAIADGRLWFCSGAIVPGSVDLETGEPLVVPEVRFAGSPRRGGAIAAVDDKWLLFGGRRLFATIDRWMTGERGMGFTLARTRIELEEGEQVVLGADVIGESIFAPVFDAELLVAASEFPDRGGQPVLQAFDRHGLISRADESKDFERKFLSRRATYRFDSLIRERENVLPAGGRWQDVELAAFDAALAANLVLVVHPQGGLKSELENWQVSALRRNSGQTVWTIDFPCRPAWNGLSIAGDGSILLSLSDGGIACFRTVQ
jgi:outer membrane protein assembly factor BamB